MRYVVLGLVVMTAACSGTAPSDPLARDAGVRDAGAPRDGGDEVLLDAGALDSGPVDAGERDAGPRDGGHRDAGPRDAGPRDAGPHDAGPRDAGPRDGGHRDAGPRDAGTHDGGTPDSGAPDAGSPDGGVLTHTVELRGVWAYAEFVSLPVIIPGCDYNTMLATGSCQFEVPDGEWITVGASDWDFFPRACHVMEYTVLCGSASCGVNTLDYPHDSLWCYFPVVGDVVIAAHHIRTSDSALCTELTCAELNYACGVDNFGTLCGTCSAGETCFQSATASVQTPYFGTCIPNTCP